MELTPEMIEQLIKIFSKDLPITIVYDNEDFLGLLPCIPKWFKFPVIDSSPLLISIIDYAFDK